MSELSLDVANAIITASLAKAKEAQMKPLAITVLDAGGHLKAFQRQDGASMLRHQISAGKAYGALGVGKGSRWLHAAALERPHFIEGLNAVSGGRIVPVPGGVLIIDGESKLLGAVGVSGDTSDNDEIAAVAGIEASGLKAQVD
ncbi:MULTISPECIES: heme-binding protein [unclassified Mesorhizobium]|uniref:GlcG/HbpS family heme-binding protein n=1 Tax=unclassified Mesorhizobium TaxID=325217 RepID=UPI0024154975|nr:MULTISPECIES: heme-binding protein [unclassified Mesorhizobium]MDG4890118.1 heme-binding protein [Mesorhizobium sp. WSM4887]MDG4904260.1 heme-binding protein [Mesorhizobium sp. WSM4962]MDG4909287.1 heme-binding protein [Mesorhizobium sp. WSM4898]MDG4921911.1 heme-binding protein [Mesorhizobium sp. WSM4989]